MLPTPRIDTIIRGTPNLVAILNPEEGFTGAELTPSALRVRVTSMDGVTEYHDVAATSSAPISAALTAKYGTTVRAWVATLPAATYGGATEVLVTRTLTVGGVAHPRTERASVVGV
jgi:hypothetical protein